MVFIVANLHIFGLWHTFLNSLNSDNDSTHIGSHRGQIWHDRGQIWRAEAIYELAQAISDVAQDISDVAQPISSVTEAISSIPCTTHISSLKAHKPAWPQKSYHYLMWDLQSMGRHRLRRHMLLGHLLDHQATCRGIRSGIVNQLSRLLGVLYSQPRNAPGSNKYK